MFVVSPQGPDSIRADRTQHFAEGKALRVVPFSHPVTCFNLPVAPKEDAEAAPRVLVDSSAVVLLCHLCVSAA